MEAIINELRAIGKSNGIENIETAEFAELMDSLDELRSCKDEFLFPPGKTRESKLYLCGNSLGLQPKGLREKLNQYLDKWATQGVYGHHIEPNWVDIANPLKGPMARLVGALPSEVVMMNTLTVNVHMMMASFYRPTPTRHKILMEKKAFPSDQYATYSQIELHGYTVADSLIEIAPREGENNVRLEDIQAILDREGESIALVHIGGVHFYTGQLFDMQAITAMGHAKGCIVGFDLAHAVGNIPVKLHDWGVDFATWCTYKYLNSGPGCMGGAFVHSKHTDGSAGVRPRLAGWFGGDPRTRFHMNPEFIPDEGANGFVISNPSPALAACIEASLEIFDRVGIDKLRNKSLKLTTFLDYLIRTHLGDKVSMLTPSDPHQRGCQLSLYFEGGIVEIMESLSAADVVFDERKPNVIRIAPTPLYNTYRDVFDFFTIIKSVLLKTAVPASVIELHNAPKPVGAYPHARKEGNLLFLSGIGPRQASNNAIPGGPIRGPDKEPLEYDVAAQTRQVIENVRLILDGCGASLNDIIDVQVFLVDMDRDFASFNAVYAEYFSNIKATRTTVSIRALPTPIAVEFKVIAKAPDAVIADEADGSVEAITANIVELSHAPKPVGAYPHARKFGDLLFLSGIGPRQAATNSIPGGPIRDSNKQPLDYDVAAQTQQVVENVKLVLEGCGASLEDIIDIQVFLVNMDRDFAAYNKVYAEHFSNIKATRTTIAVRALPTPIAVEFKVIARAPGSRAEAVVAEEASAAAQTAIVELSHAPKPVGAYPHARKYGDLLFLSGIGPRQAGTNAIPGGPIRDKDLQPLDYDVAAQTRQVIENIRIVLEGSGATLDDIIDVQAFLVNMDRDFAAYNKVYAEFFSSIKATRTTVAIRALPTPIAVEFKVIAKLRK